MNKAIKDILRLLIIPFILLATYFIVFLLWIAFDLPPAEELTKIVTNYFNTYGLGIIFISALIEGFFILGQYFPGSTIIFIGVISAGKDVTRAVEVVVIVSIAFIIAYYGDYLIGRYGWYKLFLKFGVKHALEQAKKRISKHVFKGIVSSYWEPSLATIAATAAGILQISHKKFLIYSTIGVIFWLSFWGTLVFILGQAALQIMGPKYILIIFMIWVAFIIAAYFIEKRNERRLNF